MLSFDILLTSIYLIYYSPLYITHLINELLLEKDHSQGILKLYHTKFVFRFECLEHGAALQQTACLYLLPLLRTDIKYCTHMEISVQSPLVSYIYHSRENAQQLHFMSRAEQVFHQM